MDLVYFILCAFGMTQIIVYGKLFDPIRPACDKYLGFFHCPMCVGFWVGAFLCGINTYTELFIFEINVTNIFLLGCLSSGTSYILSTLFDDWGIRSEHFTRRE